MGNQTLCIFLTAERTPIATAIRGSAARKSFPLATTITLFTRDQIDPFIVHTMNDSCSHSHARIPHPSQLERSLSQSPFSPAKLGLMPPPPARNSGEFSRLQQLPIMEKSSRASSVCSATSRDIDTMYSASSVNSPASTCYNSETSDWAPTISYDSWRMRRQSRAHYRQTSTASNSTWAYDSDGEPKRWDFQRTPNKEIDYEGHRVR